MNRLIVFVLAAIFAACTAHSPRSEETAVLFPLAPSASDVHHAKAAFDTWVRTSGRTPGAAFRVIQVGPTRADVRERLIVTIPAIRRAECGREPRSIHGASAGAVRCRPARERRGVARQSRPGRNVRRECRHPAGA